MLEAGGRKGARDWLKFVRFVLFRPIQKRSFNLLCVLDPKPEQIIVFLSHFDTVNMLLLMGVLFKYQFIGVFLFKNG